MKKNWATKIHSEPSELKVCGIITMDTKDTKQVKWKQKERGKKKNKTAKAKYQQHLYVSSTLYDISNDSA